MKKSALLLFTFALGCTSFPNQNQATNYKVIDGDSVKFNGDSVRLKGYDTPETRQYKCPEERALGKAATKNLENLINTADNISLELERKKNGEPRRDKYGRLLGSLFINGKNVAILQVDAGLARYYDGGKRQSWCT